MTTARLGIEIIVDEKGDIKIKDIGPAVEKSAQQAANGFEKTSKAASKTTGVIGDLSDKVQEFGPLIASYFGAQAIGGVIGLADEMTTLNSKIGLVTDSSEEYAAVQALIYANAQETGTGIKENIQSFTGLAQGLKDVGVQASEVLAINEAVNKSLIVSGATAEQTASFQLQFVQAMQSGVVQGDEFRAMMESNSVFAQELARALETDIAGLREMSKQGQLTAKVIRDAIPEMAESINTSFESIPITIERATTQVSNAFAKVISDGNEVSNGTNSIAQEISGLATVVEQNTPAIQAMFGVIITGAEVAVKGVSFLEGTFKTVSAAALGVAAPIFDIIAAATELTNTVGLTNASVEEWQVNAEAARSASLDLAQQSNESFQRMRGELEQNIAKEAEYKAALESNLASIEADKAAQAARAETTVAGINKITAAEKKAAEERQATVAQMYETLEVGGEEYFRNEAQKLLDQAAKWEEAGADQIATQQFLYEKITALSEQAWEAQEHGAGMYLDGLTASYTSATADIAADIETINSMSIDVPADMSTEQFASGVADVDSEVDRITNTPAVLTIDGDNDGALSALSEVQEQAQMTTSMLEQAMSGVGGALALNADDIISGAVDILGGTGVYRAAQRAQQSGDETFSYQSHEYRTSDFYSFAGGGHTGYQPRVGGIDGQGGFMAIMHPQEEIIDHADRGTTNNNSSSSTTINNNVTLNVYEKKTNSEIADLMERQKINQGRSMQV